MKRPALWVAGGLLVLGLNSLYLGARADADLLYFANVLLHVGLGLAVAVALARLLRREWEGLSLGWRAAGVAFGAGAVLGLALVATGTTRPWRWLLYAHLAAVALSALLALLAGLRRPLSLSAGRVRQAAVAGVLLALAAPVARLTVDLNPELRPVANPSLPPARMDDEGGGARGPFFPSSAETDVGGIVPSGFFMKSQECARCHREIYDQWNSSAHHFSSFNNQWYRKSVEYMQDVIGPRPSKWCAGCHDHALLFAGKFDTPIKDRIMAPESQAGLGCLSCHSIVHVKSTMGNGDFTLEYPPLHDLAVSDNPLVRGGHDFLLRLDPGPHSRTFIKSFHRGSTPEFCSACHKVHLDLPVNSYRWIRGFNEYDNWQASGVSGQGARSFYYPKEPMQCADCHMPLVPSTDPAAREGKIHSHRFPAANTALPYVNGDAEQLEVVQAFLKAGQVTIDVFGVVRAEEKEPVAQRTGAFSEPRLSTTFAAGEEAMGFGGGPAVITPPAEISAPLGAVRAVVRRGESSRVEVVVRTRKVGHFFPGGTVDAFDVWVELEAKDSNGRTILHSGAVADGGRGPVDPAAHFYRSLMLDEHGNPINKRNAWATRSVAYVHLIPPGAADTVHYRLRVPPDCGDRITLTARLNYRKFAWWNTQWAFAGVRDPQDKAFALGPGFDDGRWEFTGDTSGVIAKVKEIPNIPITVMAEASAQLEVLPSDAPLPPAPVALDPSVRERWNDYGIGLLLQGDLKGAEAAFLKVTRAEPGYADGWVNVGRARLQEGNLDGAEKVLRQALEVDPDLAKTHFFLGSTLKESGRYDEALAHLRRAAELYPRDRVVHNQIGRVLFLERKYKDAIAELQKVLAIDPEDLQAHYNLMLSYQGAGDREMARRHEAFYRRFKANEAAQEITGPYRRLHPYDNNERQAIHEHGILLEEAARTTPRYARRGSPPAPAGRPAMTARKGPAIAPAGGARPAAGGLR
jgi:tetratricopeptide (TPR) repeat protein